jgi:D-3-phosphoglycerate dehydrogenase
MIVMGLLRPSLETVNMVNAPIVAKDRGIKISETKSNDGGDYHTLIVVKVTTPQCTLSLAGSLFSGKPRLVAIDNVLLEAELTPSMLFVRNQDKPGFIGRLGGALGDAKINIANFMLGRSEEGADAVCLVAADGTMADSIRETVKALPGVVSAHLLRF